MNQLPHIIRKLEHHRSILNELLSDCNSKQIPIIIAHKIQALESMILDIPSEFEALYYSWRVIVIDFWKSLFDKFYQYYQSNQISIKDQNSIQEFQWDSKPIFEFSNQNQDEIRYVSESFTNLSKHFRFGNFSSSSTIEDLFDEKILSNRKYKENSNYTPSISSPLSVSLNSMQISSDGKKKQSIKNDITFRFSNLSQNNNCMDVDDLECLVDEVATAVNMLNPYQDDSQLQNEMFTLAAKNLPNIKLEPFLAECERGTHRKCLKDLKIYLCKLLSDCYKERKQKRSFASVVVQNNFSSNDSQQKQPQSTSSFNQSLNPVNSKQYCVYCHKIGHYLEICPKILGRRCFRCWKLGHKASFCNTPRQNLNCSNCGLNGHIACNFHEK
ncbi:hypothetical protein BLOT_014576 [Blomia tropicalis]|nr:hypothetical protein BLOT_014576 [Blomia tropicalis]